MREIKFRYVAQQEDTGRIVCMVFSLEEIEEGHARNWIDFLGKRYFLIAKNQYTGLKDSKGREIYEGDIVKCGHLSKWTYENPVRIAEVKICPDIEFHSQVGVFKFGAFAYQKTEEALEVIGNTHENPELLVKEQK